MPRFSYGPFTADLLVDSELTPHFPNCRYVAERTGAPGSEVSVTRAHGAASPVSAGPPETPRSGIPVPGSAGPFATLAPDRSSITIRFPTWTAAVSRSRADVRLAEQQGSTSDLLDTVLSSVGLAMALLSGGIVLHSSSVVTSSGACVLMGPSGRGKSTLARALARSGAIILSDDQTVLSPTGSGFAAQTAVRSNGRSEPVRGLYFLEQGTQTRRTRLSRKEAFPLLLRQALLFPSDPALHELLLDAASRLVDAVPACRLVVGLSDVSPACLEE